MKKLILLSSIIFLGGCSTPNTNINPEIDDIPSVDLELDTELEQNLDDDVNRSYNELLLSYVFIDVVNLKEIILPTSILNEEIKWSYNDNVISKLTGSNQTYYISALIGNSSRNFNITFKNNKVSSIYQQDLIFNYYFISDNNKLGSNMNPSTIVVHNTANTASAYNEIMYLNSTSNTGSTSYHYAVDDVGVYQGVRSNVYAHHAGNLEVNKTSIGIEIAKSLLNDPSIKDKAINNAQKLIRLLQMQYNISNVITHKDVTGKHCPHDIYDRYTIDRFYSELNNMYTII